MASKKNQRQLRKENGRDAEAEVPVAGFMVKQTHTQPCAHAAAEDRKEKQRFFADAAAVVFRFPFVETVNQKDREIKQQKKQQLLRKKWVY